MGRGHLSLQVLVKFAKEHWTLMREVVTLSVRRSQVYSLMYRHHFFIDLQQVVISYRYIPRITRA